MLKAFWDPEGQLVLSAICDAADNLLRAKAYFYDARGNVVEERIFGHLTGTNKSLLKIDGNGHFDRKNVENFARFFTYSADRNLLLEEKDENGLKITYGYLTDTDLVTEKRLLHMVLG